MYFLFWLYQFYKYTRTPYLSKPTSFSYEKLLRKVLRTLKITKNLYTVYIYIYIACVNIAFILEIIIYLHLPKEQISHNLLHLHAALHHITTISLEPAKGHYALQHLLCKAHNQWQWVHVWKYWRSSLNMLVIII